MADSTSNLSPIAAARLTTARPAATIASPPCVLAALGAVGHRRILLETASAPQLDATPGNASHQLVAMERSILVARPLLHFESRGGLVTWTALADESGPLLAALSERLPTASHVELSKTDLRAQYPTRPQPGLVSDAERLRQPTVLDAVRATSQLLIDPPASGHKHQLSSTSGSPMPPGVFGALGYELVDHFETLPPRATDPLDEPDFSLVLAGDVIEWDHRTEQVTIVTRSMPWEEARTGRARHQALVEAVASVPPQADTSTTKQSVPSCNAASAPPPNWSASLDETEFKAVVETFLEAVRGGHIFQGVPSRQFRTKTNASSLDVYAHLRRHNPSPYMFHADLGNGVLLGASPETCVRVDRGTVEIRPIAGTAPRGRDHSGAIDPDLDCRLALALSLDSKEIAEHCMLIDLARNDIARGSKPGSTRVVQQMQIEAYSHVQHLVSRVRGELRDGLDALHAYRAVANMGTLTGAPKPRAMELIRNHEPTARGFYGGAVGYLLRDGSFDSCIVIRSARMRDGEVFTQAGAGVVAASKPAHEFLETETKARAVREAVAFAAGIANNRVGTSTGGAR